MRTNVVPVGFTFVVFSTCLGLWLVLRRGDAARRKTATRVMLGIGAWLVCTYALARAGLLEFTRTPPLAAPVILVANVAATVLALSKVGGVIASSGALGALVMLNGFRVPLELVMHRAAAEGAMPVQMSFSGWNFDIVTGLLAVAFALHARLETPPRWALWLWNVVGVLLLVNVVTISILSTPPLHAFGFERVNVWIVHAPYVWLPTFLVPVAWFSHCVTFRALLSNANGALRDSQ